MLLPDGITTRPVNKLDISIIFEITIIFLNGVKWIYISQGSFDGHGDTLKDNAFLCPISVAVAEEL